MSLVGFRHLLPTAQPLEADDFTVRVAPAHVLLLLKVVAYLDRPWERRHDLQDIAWLLEEGIPPDDARRFEQVEELLDAGIEFEHAGAYLLGSDLGRLMDDGERDLLDAFVQKAMDETDGHATGMTMVALGPPRWRHAGDEPTRMMTSLERGLRTRHEAVR